MRTTRGSSRSGMRSCRTASAQNCGSRQASAGTIRRRPGPRTSARSRDAQKGHTVRGPYAP